MTKLATLTVLSLALAFAAVSISASTTQDFNAYGAGILPCCGGAVVLGFNSVAFPGFTLTSSSANLQLDAPGYFGAVNYELLGYVGSLTIGFTNPQAAFSMDLRDFSGYSGIDTITVYATDNVTVLNTYAISLNGTIVTFSDPGESAPIGSVNLSLFDGGWSGLLNSVTYNVTSATPETGSLALFGTGVLGLAGLVRRKLNL